jgi:recombination associated protein RdgC
MFKNLSIFRITSMPAGFDALADNPFTPCQPNEAKSSGWVPPRGYEHGQLAEVVGGQIILKLMTETKAVPAEVVQRRVDEAVQQIEASTGRKPGKKERRDIKEDAVNALLPQAFPKRSATLVWIDPATNLLAIDSASQNRTDDVMAAMIKSLDGLAVQYVNTQQSPAGSMAHWLVEQEPPQGFTIDRECELKANDESKAVVKYGRHPLDIDEVCKHVQQGKMPTKLAMTFDDRVSFVLTEAMTLKKVEMLEAALIGDNGMTLEDEAFDADVAIATGELRNLIPVLLDALGGELVTEGGAA